MFNIRGTGLLRLVSGGGKRSKAKDPWWLAIVRAGFTKVLVIHIGSLFKHKRIVKGTDVRRMVSWFYLPNRDLTGSNMH